MQLWCGEILDNYLIANCIESVPVKEFWKSVNNQQDMDNTKFKWQIGLHYTVGKYYLNIANLQGCHSPVMIKFPDFSRHFKGT